jgi:hypothetical protein
MCAHATDVQAANKMVERRIGELFAEGEASGWNVVVFSCTAIHENQTVERRELVDPSGLTIDVVLARASLMIDVATIFFNYIAQLSDGNESRSYMQLRTGATPCSATCPPRRAGSPRSASRNDRQQSVVAERESPAEEETCRTAVMAAIRQAGRRMSATAVTDELIRCKKAYSQSAVSQALTALVNDGELTNPRSRGGRHAGYGLPEWPAG